MRAARIAVAPSLALAITLALDPVACRASRARLAPGAARVARAGRSRRAPAGVSARAVAVRPPSVRDARVDRAVSVAWKGRARGGAGGRVRASTSTSACGPRFAGVATRAALRRTGHRPRPKPCAGTRALLGPDAWELVRADREAPARPARPGRSTAPPSSASSPGSRPRPGGALMDLAEVRANGDRILDEIERAVVGKRDVLELILLGLLADGHVLLEDVPGLAKTLAARSFAAVTGLGFARVQFTPDLLPSDVTGSSIWNQRDADFEFRPGPIFANLLLADEINRAPPKTQAALLEAMQERQVTVDGTTHAAGARRSSSSPRRTRSSTKAPTRCPRRSSTGSCCKTAFGYPSADDEWEMLARRIARRVDEVELAAVVDRTTLLAMQAAVEDVHVDADVGRYVGRARARHARERERRGRLEPARQPGAAQALSLPRRPRRPRLRHPGRREGGRACRRSVTASCSSRSSGCSGARATDVVQRGARLGTDAAGRRPGRSVTARSTPRLTRIRRPRRGRARRGARHTAGRARRRGDAVRARACAGRSPGRAPHAPGRLPTRSRAGARGQTGVRHPGRRARSARSTASRWLSRSPTASRSRVTSSPSRCTWGGTTSASSS